MVRRWKPSAVVPPVAKPPVEVVVPTPPVSASVTETSKPITPRFPRLTLIIGLVGTVTLIMVVIGFWWSRSRTALPAQTKPGDKTVLASPTPTPEPSFTVALVGYGGAGHDGAYLTDSIMVARILLQQKKIVLLSLPRDLWVQLPSGDTPPAAAKVNAAFAMGLSGDRLYPNRTAEYRGAAGGGNALKYELQQITGWTVDRYLGIDFLGFAKTIDALGGITVNVERTFDDYEYPISGREDAVCAHSYPLPTDTTTGGESPAPTPTVESSPTPLPPVDTGVLVMEDEIVAGRLDPHTPNLLSKDVRLYPCRYEHLHFEAGPQTMNGATALKFVRSRHAVQDGSDFGRSRRQQLFLLAVLDQVFRLNFIAKIPDVYATVRSNIMTDFTAVDIASWLAQANEVRQYPITHIALTNQNYLELAMSADRQSILQPTAGIFNWSDIQNWLRWQTMPSAELVAPVVQITAPANRQAIAANLRTKIQQQTHWPVLPVQLTMTKTTKSAAASATSEASPSAHLRAVSPRVSGDALKKLSDLTNELLPTVIDDPTASAAATINNSLVHNVLIQL
jgi:LCP family protein required for cell wall assembly